MFFSQVAEFRGGFRGVSSRLMVINGLLDDRFCDMLRTASMNCGWWSRACSKGPAWLSQNPKKCPWSVDSVDGDEIRKSSTEIP
jgi:hypothetical protein